MFKNDKFPIYIVGLISQAVFIFILSDVITKEGESLRSSVIYILVINLILLGAVHFILGKDYRLRFRFSNLLFLITILIIYLEWLFSYDFKKHVLYYCLLFVNYIFVALLVSREKKMSYTSKV